jgi:hypothetical protein
LHVSDTDSPAVVGHPALYDQRHGLEARVRMRSDVRQAVDPIVHEQDERIGVGEVIAADDGHDGVSGPELAARGGRQGDDPSELAREIGG